MITGFNTDVPFAGKVYHVQTEDRGADNPVIESLVYLRGQILDAVKTEYADEIPTGDKAALAAMLEAQHKRIIRSIKNGRYDPDAIKPFGHGIISDRPFDEVVLEFIQSQAANESIQVRVEELSDLAAGWTGALELTLRTSVLNRPVRDCFLRITVEREDGRKPLRLFEGVTDHEGRALAEVTLPDSPARGELLITAESPAGPVEARLAFPKGS